jgi:hypothetical protein
MAKKMRRVRTFARTAAKSMEKKLVENAKEIQNDPYLIIPDYSDNFSNKIFNKTKKSLDKIIRFKDDIDKLEKLSNKRDLSGALAGTLTIANSEKAPYLGVAKFPTGDITYAQRGRADKEKLIAFQHFDDPVLRLLGIKDIAIKRRLYVYSWDQGFVSTGLEANPPKEFIDFILKKTNLSNKSEIATCGDIKTDVIKNKEIFKKNYLRIYWKSADIIIGICEDCAKSSKNTIFNITKYIIEPNISEDFTIEVIGQVVKQKVNDSDQIQKLDEYLSGKLTDLQLIEENMKYREESLKESGEKIFILDGNSYGTDIEKFINALKPNKFEKMGLEHILKKVEEPVILDNVTSNKLLEIFWKDHGLDAIGSLINDNEMAEKFFSLDDTPSDILELVYNYNERQQILSQLPKYKNLPKLAKFIDDIVRTYKTFGEKEALAEIKKRPDDPKAKSISYAFLLAFGKGKDKKWQYSQVEVEYGEFLKDYAKNLLDSEPKKYHKYLKDLLTSSGSSEDIDDCKV